MKRSFVLITKAKVDDFGHLFYLLNAQFLSTSPAVAKGKTLKKKRQVCKSPFKTTSARRTASQRDTSKLQKQLLTKLKITQTPDLCIIAKTNWQSPEARCRTPTAQNIKLFEASIHPV